MLVCTSFQHFELLSLAVLVFTIWFMAFFYILILRKNIYFNHDSNVDYCDLFKKSTHIIFAAQLVAQIFFNSLFTECKT